MLSIAEHETSRTIKLGLNKSMIVRLPVPARDVLVSGPKKVDAVVRTARTVYLMGLEVGQTNVFFFDQEGRQILSLEIAGRARHAHAARHPAPADPGPGH